MARGERRPDVRSFLRRLGQRGAAPAVTWFLAGLNLLVYAAMVANGVPALDPGADDLLAWGSSLAPVTLGEGQVWRLLTSTFVHYGAVHLLINMVFLLRIGRIVEWFYGPTTYLALYVFSGVFASLVSAAVQPDAVSAGASGALFGVMGAYVAFFRRNRHRLPRKILRMPGMLMLVYATIALAAGGSDEVDNAAHFGGFVAGLFLGMALRPEADLRVPAPRARPGMLAALAGVLVVSGVLARTIHAQSEMATFWAPFYRAHDAWREGDLQRAVDEFSKVIEHSPELADPYAMRGAALERLGEHAHALADLDRAIALGDEDEFTLYFRGLVHWELGSLAAARADFERCGEDADCRAALHGVLGDQAFERGDWPTAAAEYETALEDRPEDTRTRARLAEARQRAKQP